MTGQSSDFVYIHFTIEDGLPSNQCYEILEDSRGYLWIATDNGVVRYDGYNFRHYDEKDGLNDNVIFHMEEDETKKIWAGGIKNEIYIYDPGQDRFTAYKYNDLIKENITYSLEYLKQFRVSNDTLLVGLRNVGIMAINPDGSHTKHEIWKNSTNYIFSIDEDDWLIKSFTYPMKMDYDNIHLVDIWDQSDASVYFELPNFEFKDTGNPIAKSIGDYHLFYIGGNYYLVGKDKLLYNTKSKKINYIDQLSNGKITFSYDHSGGVIRYDDVYLNNPEVMLEDVSATFVLEDKQGGIWISTLESGVFYIKPLQSKFLNPTTKNKNINHVIAGEDHTLFYSSFSGEIAKYNIENGKEYLIDDARRDSYLLEYDTLRKDIYYSNSSGLYRKKHTGELKKVRLKYPTGTFREYAAKSIHILDSSIYLCTGNQIQEYNPQKEFIVTDSYDKVRPNKYPRFYDISSSSDELYFASQKGLLRIKTPLNNFENFNTIQIGERTETIDKLKEGIFILGTKGEGIFLYDYVNHKILDTIDLMDKLSSNYVEHIHLVDSSTFWVSTLAGLNKVKIGEDLKASEIQVFETNHGLPTNDIYECVKLDSRVYVATGDGLIWFEDRPINTQSASPKIRFLKVDTLVYDQLNSINVPFDFKRISIGFVTLNFQMSGNINYRYSLNGAEWVATNKNELILSDLTPSRYHFEVQSQNEDGFWSNSAEVKFLVETPFWKTPLFAILVLLFGIGLAYLIIYRYYSNKRKFDKISAELKRLEKLALRKQMNPHFIFNSLNSIQNYIMENEKTLAMEYLSMFARLIRMILNAANEERITIFDEVDLLNHYLDLEKLRFEERFDFEIKVDQSIDQYNSYIPSMLVQPIAENAVVHGMRDKKSGGIISIEFVRDSDMILVKVKDNGKGFQTNISTGETHKSFGMDITRKRLSINLNEAGLPGKVQYERIDDYWTEITLVIPLLS